MGVFDFLYESDKKKQPVAKPTPAVNSIVITQAELNSAVKEQYEKELFQVLKGYANGKTFFDFMMTKAAMKYTGDEGSAYSAVCAMMAVTAGVDKVKLLASADDCMKVIEKEILDCKSAYNTQVAQLTQGDNRLLAEKQKKIADVEAQLSQLRFEVEEIGTKTKQAYSDLSVKHDAFMAAGESVKNNIQEEQNKISKYVN